VEESCRSKLGDASISATSRGGCRDRDPRLGFLKVTSAGDREAQSGSRAAPRLSVKLDAICSASIVYC